MLTYNLHNKEKSTLYELLYTNIKNDILDGKIASNEKLPSKRSLAQHLKISIITVENAYTQLLSEGYIYSIEKKGYYACELQKTSLQKPLKSQVKTHIQPLERKKDEFLIDFKSNAVPAEKFPFSVWSKLMREVLSEKGSQLLQPMPFNGTEQLRTAIADHLYHFRGMHVLPDQILIGAGTEYLYHLLIQLLGREHVYALENPGYSKISKIYAANDVSFASIHLDSQGLSIHELKQSKANIIHISPSHHFPTGIITPMKRRQEILNWANQDSSRYIIEDDYDSEFRFHGKPIQTLQSIDANEKVIYINTFSKTIAPTIRISYMVLPFHLMEKFREEMGFYSCTVSSFEQYTLASFIEKGHFERHINRMRNFYRSQRDSLLEKIKKSPFNKKVTVLEENSGLHFILDVNTDISDEELIQQAHNNGINISCLSDYYYGCKNNLQEKNLQHKLVINYSCIDCEKVMENVHRLLSIL
ncbi:MAG: PLP-dependent aminotransferase family protein [Anaerovorax sp.]|nr:PLP-dependent aminotransferase family protein [Anaerovorax sp.]